MYRTVCLVYKSLNSMTPDYLTDMFKPLSTVSQRHIPEALQTWNCGYQNI